jgi:small-conductance mechanosensitive channel
MLAAFVLPAPITNVVDRVVLQNSIRAWLSALLAAAIILAAGLVLRRLLVAHVGALSSRTATRFDDMAFELIKQTRTGVIVCVAIFIGLTSLVLDPRVSLVVAAAMKLVLLWQAGTWGAAAVTFWVRQHLERRTDSHDRASIAMVSAIGIGARGIIWIAIVLTAMDAVFSIKVTALITGLGIGGIAVALAVQNILGDLLAALAIVFDKPFDVGDAIGVDNVTGTVEHIGLKTTRLRSTSGEQVIVGNSDLLKSRLRNYRRMSQRRVVMTLDVAYDTPPATLERLPKLVEAIVRDQGMVRFDRSHIAGLADWSIKIETVYYVLDPDYTLYMNIQQAVYLAVLRRFASEGVELAFPTQTLNVNTPSPPSPPAMPTPTTAPGSSPRPPQSTAP